MVRLLKKAPDPFDEVIGKGMKPGTPKTEVIKLMTPPKTLKELRGFVGLTNYFGHHFPFQREAKFLSSLTRKGSGWTKGPLPERAQLAFDIQTTLESSCYLLMQPPARRTNQLRTKSVDWGRFSLNRMKEVTSTLSDMLGEG